MKRLPLAPLLALALLTACEDTSGPALVASIAIHVDRAPLDEQTIGVGATLQLGASPLDASGREIPGRGVRWSSTRPEVATVDASGLVRGASPGTTLIVARSDATADTVRVNVAAPVTGPVACDPTRAGISLRVGEVYSASAWEVGTLCLEPTDTEAEYLILPFHASRMAGGARLPLELSAAGVVPVQDAATALAPGAAVGEAARDDGFHLRLRERALPGLARRMRELAPAPATPPSRSLLAAVPAPGDLLRLNVETTSHDGCTAPSYRTGRVVAVTRRAVVVADTANPAGGFTDDDYRALAAAFDETVYPLDVEHFGEPSDIDGNGRIVVFFTSAVNDLTQAGSGSYVGGFFYDRDLFPRTGRGACEGSNAAEIVYLMVPDPARETREPAFSRASVRGHTLAVAAHELQHLINASRRLHVNGAGTWEETWLNEGLSHIAEELLYYRASGLGPGMNEDGSRVAEGAARKALTDNQAKNLERYAQFLRRPHTTSPIGEDALPNRGAIWSFLRYAADRGDGSEAVLWRRLVDSRTAGMDNLDAALGADAVGWLHDWALSVYLDDAGLPVEDRYLQPSWNFRAILPVFGGSAGRFPLRTHGFQADGFLALDLPAASAAYVRVGVAPAQRAAVRVTSAGLPAPRKLRVTVVRTR